jgi:hypothetical protein
MIDVELQRSYRITRWSRKSVFAMCAEVVFEGVAEISGRLRNTSQLSGRYTAKTAQKLQRIVVRAVHKLKTRESEL